MWAGHRGCPQPPAPWSGGDENLPDERWAKESLPQEPSLQGCLVSPRDQGNGNAEQVKEVETGPALEQAQSDVMCILLDGMEWHRSSSQSQHHCLSCLWVEGRRGSSCRWANLANFQLTINYHCHAPHGALCAAAQCWLRRLKFPCSLWLPGLQWLLLEAFMVIHYQAATSHGLSFSSSLGFMVERNYFQKTITTSLFLMALCLPAVKLL